MAAEPAEEDEEVLDDDDDDDVPLQMPDGWEQTSWQPGDVISNFMVWTQVAGERRRTWHMGVVVRTLARPTVREGFTHDVCLDGTTERRGMALSTDSYDDDVWVAIQRTDRPPTPLQDRPQRAQRRR